MLVQFFFGTIPTPAYDLEVKVMDLKIYVKVFRQSFSKIPPLK